MENSKEVKVESVKAINLKTTVVTFNKEIDENTINFTNVKTYLDTSTTAATNGSGAGHVKYNLSNDKKTLTIVHGGNLAQSTNVKVSLNNVKSVDGEELVKYEKTVKAVDTTLPTVTNVTVENASKIYVNLSEPLNITGSGTSKVWTEVQINGQNFAGKITNDVANSRIVLEPSTLFPAGTHELKISSFKDFAGFVLDEQTLSFETVADTTAPTLVSVEATSNDKFTLIFDEELSTKGTVSLNGVDVTGSADIDSKDKKKLVVSNQNLGAAALVVDQVVKYKGQKDALGNEIKTEQTTTFKVTDDTVAPTATATVDKDNKIVVQFSKDVKDANKIASYELKDSKGNVVTFAAPVYDAAKKTATITPNYADLSGGKTNGGTYTLKIKKDKIVDTSVRENKLAETTLTVVAADQLAPKISEAAVETGSTTKVRVVFSEAMDEATLSNKANYIFLDGGAAGTPKRVSDITDSTVTVIDNKTVVIDVKEAITASTDIIAVQDLKDLAGNKVAYQEQKVITTAATFVSNTGALGNVKSVEQTALNKVKITLNNNAPKFTAVSANDFKLSSVNNAQTALTDTDLFVSNAVLVDDGKAVELTLSKNLTAEGKTKNNEDIFVYTVKADGTVGPAANTKNSLGASLELKTDYIKVADKVAPELDMDVIDKNNDGLVDVAGNVVTLTFTENVADSATALNTALDIRDKDGKRLVGGTGFTVAQTGNKDVVITFIPGTEAYVGSYTITLKDNVTLADVNSNLAKDFSVTTEEMTVESADAVAKAQAITDLEGSITAAQQAHDGVTEGVNVDDTIVGSKTTLNTAIATATSVKNNPASTTAQLGAAKSDLDNAKSAFDSAKVTAVTGLNAVTVATSADDSSNTVILAAGETLVLTSSDSTDAVATVTEDSAGTIKVTGVATGGPITITVEVKKDGSVIKTGTFTVTTS